MKHLNNKHLAAVLLKPILSRHVSQCNAEFDLRDSFVFGLERE